MKSFPPGSRRERLLSPIGLEEELMGDAEASQPERDQKHKGEPIGARPGTPAPGPASTGAGWYALPALERGSPGEGSLGSQPYAR